MTDHRNFIEQGLRVAGGALAEAAAKANLHLRPETLTRVAKRRCLARLRVLAVVIRRLIFLMALSMDLVPVRPRTAQPAVLPEGGEDVTASFGVQRQGFRLAPARYGPPMSPLWPVSGPSVPGPVDAAPVIARWAALYRVLKHPERHARRLARTLARWQAKREAKPFVPPMTGTHRMPADLALVAQVLPHLIGKALAGWPDTS